MKINDLLYALHTKVKILFQGRQGQVSPCSSLGRVSWVISGSTFVRTSLLFTKLFKAVFYHSDWLYL